MSSPSAPTLRFYEVGVSAFVAAVLLAQIVTIMPGVNIPGLGGARSWPILNYHMYTHSD